MAPEPLNQKRKRGRPSNAARLEADASQDRSSVAEDYDADADEATRQKKRGRPRKVLSQEEEAAKAAEAAKPKRKRGRPSLLELAEVARESPQVPEEDAERGPKEPKQTRNHRSLENDEAEAETAEDTGSPRHKGAKATTSGEQEQEQEQEQGHDDEVGAPQARPQSNRGKKRVQNDQQEQERESDQEQEESIAEPPRRKRGRPSGAKQPAAENEGETTQQLPKRKRGRPSLRDMQPSEVQNQGPRPAKPSKPAAGKAADDRQLNNDGKAQRQQPETAKTSTRASHEARPSSRSDDPSPQPEHAEAQPQKKPRRRSSQNTAAEQDDDLPASPSKPYPHVAPRVSRVRQSTIESKWSPLAEPSLSSAFSILQLAHRPILQRLSNTEQRRAHTSSALRLVTHRITRKITKGIPFPPASLTLTNTAPSRAKKPAAENDARVAELDFENILDAKQALERQLDPALHAVELLAREKENLERELERDYEALHNLESSARAQAREHRGLLKKAHVLAPKPEETPFRKNKDDTNIVFNPKNNSFSGGLFHDLQDPDLKSLALQLSNHTDSLKNNLQQTDGILPQLVRSRAALQTVLFSHLKQEQYERVLLG